MLLTSIVSMLSMTRLRSRAARPSAVAIGLVMVMSLSGCAVGPKYRRPSVPVPPQFKESAAPATQPGAITPIAYSDWWRVVDDPVLDRLERDADAANQDIRVAVASSGQSLDHSR